MDEAAFLADYEPAAYARPSLAVDLVLMSVVDGAPAVLLGRRDAHPHRGRWALPGGFVGIDEGLDAAARRVLADKAHMAHAWADAWMEQLYTFGAPGRDPRTRIVSVAYWALLPPARFDAALAGGGLTLARLDADGGTPLPLAFDHGDMLALAMTRLRGRLDYSPVAAALLPERFTLSALRRVHEAIVGRSLNKAAFRRRLLDTGWLEATGERETGTSHRPPELYRFKEPRP